MSKAKQKQNNQSELAHTLKIKNLEKKYHTKLSQGLTSNQVEKRLKQYGKNKLPEPEKDPLWKKFLAQFQDFLIYILIAGIIFSFIAGEYLDGLVILAIVLGNAILAFIQENKAERDLEEIKKISAPHCHVKRNGKVQQVLASQIVPGDILVLETGDQVAADVRLTKVTKLEIDESSLTGESMFVKKQLQPLSDATVLADRNNMCFKYTLVRYGRGEGVVVATGLDTQIGKIAEKLIETEDADTPLEKQLEKLGKKLGIVSLAMCSLIFIINWAIRQHPIIRSVIESVSLAIAVVPEGLPAIVTICLAIGVQMMRKRNAIVRNLPSIETLGSTDYICTDKTGTVTEGEMSAVEVGFEGKLFKFRTKFDKDNKTFKLLMEVGRSCNNATESSGSPTEQALYNITKKNKAKALKKVDEFPFDSARKAMSTIHKQNNHYVVYAKGSPEVILNKSTAMLQKGKQLKMTKKRTEQIQKDISTMTKQGLRVLAFAYKETKKIPKKIKDSESDLVFLGLIGFKDPIRKTAKESIARIKQAGIIPVMITGDQHETAFIIAKEAGIIDKNSKIDKTVVHGTQLADMSDEQLQNICEDVRVYARVEPNDKLRIIQALRSLNHVVAMTGDGVNDSPAVKAADIGLAMGIRGTEVTKSAADVVLTDDNYATIASAVAQGRVILRNIKFFTSYLLSCNTSEILIVFLAIIVGLEMPFNARLLLWLNIVTDFLPALAMAYETDRDSTMKKGPNPAGAPVIDRRMWLHISVQTLVTTAIVFGTYVYYLRISQIYAMTASFIVLSLGEVYRALTARSHELSLVKIGIFKNKMSLAAIVSSTFLTLLLIYSPLMNKIFTTVHLETAVVFELAVFALAMPIAEEFTKLFIRKYNFQPYKK